MLGARIALLRRSQGLSQADLARQLHISPSAVGMYEQDRREPSLAVLVALAQEFSVSADYLLTGRPLNSADQQAMDRACRAGLRGNRAAGHLSREELSVLLEAMLTEA